MYTSSTTPFAWQHSSFLPILISNFGTIVRLHHMEVYGWPINYACVDLLQLLRMRDIDSALLAWHTRSAILRPHMVVGGLLVVSAIS